MGNEQGKVAAELKAYLSIVKDCLRDKIEIKELVCEIKKEEKSSEGGKKTLVHGNKFDDDGEESSRPSTKRVELLAFEGSDPLGWMARAEMFFEVQNVTQT